MAKGDFRLGWTWIPSLIKPAAKPHAGHRSDRFRAFASTRRSRLRPTKAQ